VDGAVADGAEQVVAGRVALEEVLQVAGDEVIDHKRHYIDWRFCIMFRFEETVTENLNLID